MTLRFTRRALVELDEILSYIAVRSPSGAAHVRQRLQAILDLLATNPKMGRRTSNARLRRMAVMPYPYLVFFEIDGNDVIVIGIRHAARDPEGMPGT